MKDLVHESTSAVEFVHMTKAFGACVSVSDVSAAFSHAKIHAILGENGAGKSTLMKLLFGLLSPTEGSLQVDGKERHWRSPADAISAGLGMVQQHFTLVETLSVIDNIMLGYEKVAFAGILNREAAIAELEKNLPSKALSLNWHQPVSELSVGEKQKVEILKLIARKAQILVLDEPTAVLSPQEIEGLFAILKSLRAQGRTVFVITHKLAEVFDHCDTWFVLRNGKAVGSGHISQTKTDDVVRAMVGTSVPPLADRTPSRQGDTLLRFEHVTVAGVAHPVYDLSFEVRAGEVLGIAGVDGSGQAEIVEALLGLRTFEGRVNVLNTTLPENTTSAAAAKVLANLREQGLALVSEDRHHQSLWMDETVQLNAGLGFETQNQFFKNGWINTSRWRTTISAWLKSFDVRFPSLETSVARLSGGNQQKLIFAREFLGRAPKLIVVHQPTRGVDFAAIRLIHERIIEARDRGAAVLVISSELDELMALSDRMLVLCGGRQRGLFQRSAQAPAFDRDQVGRAMTNASEAAITPNVTAHAGEAKPAARSLNSVEAAL